MFRLGLLILFKEVVMTDTFGGSDSPEAGFGASDPTTVLDRGTIKINLVNNDGAGFSGEIEVPQGMTLEELFDEKASGDSSDYVVRVNRESSEASYELQENDWVQFTPRNIKGA